MWQEDARLIVSGQLENGLNYEAQLGVVNLGGQVKSRRKRRIHFENCDALTIFLVADTDYLADFERNWRGKHPREAVTRRLENAVA